MTTAISVLKPGFLVSLKTSLRGGVKYERIDLERESQTAAGALRAKWETTKEITDPDEFVAASKARGEARALVSRVCCPSAFGLLCPSDQETQLQDAIAQARDIVRTHNKGARLSLVEVYVMVGRIAQDDAEAARAIASEVRGLLEAMKAGIQAADPDAIRDAASKAKAIGAMLSEEVAGRVADAVKEARAAARDIVRRVETSGEAAADVVAQLSMKALDGARFAFLDMDAGQVVSTAPEAPAVEIDNEYEPNGTGSDPAQVSGEVATVNASGVVSRALEF